jgi:hypothetical protein
MKSLRGIQRRLDNVQEAVKAAYGDGCEHCHDWPVFLGFFDEGDLEPEDPWPCPHCGHDPDPPRLILTGCRTREDWEHLGMPIPQHLCERGPTYLIDGGMHVTPPIPIHPPAPPPPEPAAESTENKTHEEPTQYHSAVGQT